MKIKLTGTKLKLNFSDPEITDFINLVGESTDKFDFQNTENTEKYKFIILNLLSQFGPMDTKEIHKKIEADFPELCGTEERVIKGRKFGKLWKHQVRNAQQSLKNQNL